MTREFEPITRPASERMDAILGKPFPLLDHGFVRLIDYMGDETAIVQAARVSYGKGTETVSSDRALLRYLMRHRHTTPFEMCEIKLHVRLPIFVARQWVRHRTASINEYSARYSILSREFYVPHAEDIQKQSTTNKQGRAGAFSESEAMLVQAVIRDVCGYAYQAYEGLADKAGYNVARELARGVLPVNFYTEWYWKTDLHNLLHFLKLRMDPHAQKEIRVYADLIGGMVEGWVPNVWEAFDDYVLGAHTFSRSEMEIVRDIIARHGLTKENYARIGALSKREQSAFFAAVGVDMESANGNR